MTFKLYKITNQVNSRIFIGVTSSSLEQKWQKHLSDAKSPFYPLHCDIQKYGEDKFVIELVSESDDRIQIAKVKDKLEVQNQY